MKIKRQMAWTKFLHCVKWFLVFGVSSITIEYSNNYQGGGSLFLFLTAGVFLCTSLGYFIGAMAYFSLWLCGLVRSRNACTND